MMRSALARSKSLVTRMRVLAAGEKSREQLRRENGHFAFASVRVSLRGAKPLE
jgi:hypothetical protein